MAQEYSVLMSVYFKDSPDELKQSIESMLNQTIRCNQFVIVEDGPLGVLLDEVIEDYVKQYPHLFTIVKLEENKGLGNALNVGMKLSRNELIARMDADDISFPDRCEKELLLFSKKPDLCIVGTQIKEFIGTIDNVVSMRNVPCDFESIKKFSRRRSPFNHPTVMYKKSIIEKLGGYPTLHRKEDLGLFILAVNSGCYCENLNEALLFYRTSKENQRRRQNWTNCKEYIQVMLQFYIKGFLGFDDLLYVLVGQLTLYFFPPNITKRLSKKYLRN